MDTEHDSLGGGYAWGGEGESDSDSSESIVDEDEASIEKAEPPQGFVEKVKGLAVDLAQAMDTVRNALSDSPMLQRMIRVVSRANEASSRLRPAFQEINAASKAIGPEKFTRVWKFLAKRSNHPHFPRTHQEFADNIVAAFKSVVALPRILFQVGMTDGDPNAPQESRIDHTSLPSVLDALEQAVAAWGHEIEPAALRMARGLRALGAGNSFKEALADVHSGVATIMESLETIKTDMTRATKDVWDRAAPEPKVTESKPREGWWGLIYRGVCKFLLTALVVLVAVVGILLIVAALAMLLFVLGGPAARILWPSLYAAVGNIPWIGTLLASPLRWFVPDKLGDTTRKVLNVPEGVSLFGLPKKAYFWFLEQSGFTDFGAANFFFDPTPGEAEAQAATKGAWEATKGAFGPATAAGAEEFASRGFYAGALSFLESFAWNVDIGAGVEAHNQHHLWILQNVMWPWIKFYLWAMAKSLPYAARGAWKIGRAALKAVSGIWSSGADFTWRGAYDIIGAAIKAELA